MHYAIGEPVGIYRIFQGEGSKTFKSVITSYCTITKIDIIRNSTRSIISIDEFIKSAGNKTIFSVEELTKIYKENANVVMIEMVYNGFFGKGHNVTHRKLSDSGLFPAHPYNIDYTRENFTKILEMGDINVQNVIIN